MNIWKQRVTAALSAAGIMLTVVGVAIGVAMHRFNLLRQACETWVAAVASEDLARTR